jgi:hypothetical protein
MTRTWTVLFALSGGLALVGSISSPVIFPYALFVLVYLRGWRLPMVGPPAWRLLVSILLCTFVLEFGAWLDNFIRNSPEPALFHPQLIPDLIISVGVYSAWWLTWWFVLRRYRFTTRQVFITTGLYGVLIEQEGKVFIAGLQTLPLGIIYWLFVFIVYGSTMALAYFLVRDSFHAQGEHWHKYPLAWGALLLLTFATSIAWGVLIEQALHIIPPRKFPMWDFPFW